MKRINYLWAIILMASFSALTSCGGNSTEPAESTEVVAEVQETQSNILASYFAENGDQINATEENNGFPKFIMADKVYEELGGYILVIDLRGGQDFAGGHIDGAINLKLENLLYYFKEDLNPDDYDKIVLVCYSGQTSSYATGILNLMGYNNVYTMKWGMASWNKEFAGKWLENVSSDYVEDLETTDNPKAVASGLPVINTGKTEIKDIIEAQAASLFETGFKAVRLKIGDIMTNPSDYYIVSYTSDETYQLGHLKGAIQYSPKSSLGLNQSLETLPKDKPIIVYCYSGQNAAFVVSYLRMIGYDASLLLYGANSFMNSIIIENNMPAFNEDQINDFETIKSDYSGAAEKSGGGC